jgi:hypothetical protein
MEPAPEDREALRLPVGRPTELLLEALAKEFDPNGSHPMRLVELGRECAQDHHPSRRVLRSVDLHLMSGGFGSVSLMQAGVRAIPRSFRWPLREPRRLSSMRLLWPMWNRPGTARNPEGASYLRLNHSRINVYLEKTSVTGNTLGVVRCLRY